MGTKEAKETTRAIATFNNALIDAERSDGDRALPKLTIGQGRPRGPRALRMSVTAKNGHVFSTRKKR